VSWKKIVKEKREDDEKKEKQKARRDLVKEAAASLEPKEMWKLQVKQLLQEAKGKGKGKGKGSFEKKVQGFDVDVIGLAHGQVLGECIKEKKEGKGKGKGKKGQGKGKGKEK
jgi:hypothetical protein